MTNEWIGDDSSILLIGTLLAAAIGFASYYRAADRRDQSLNRNTLITCWLIVVVAMAVLALIGFGFVAATFTPILVTLSGRLHGDSRRPRAPGSPRRDRR
jgi:uncharacterized membrane protein